MAEGMIVKKSKTRQELEDLLREKGIVIEKISVVNMDSGETNYFDSYPDAMEFLKGRKGRWYITTPGIRRSNDAKRR